MITQVELVQTNEYFTRWVHHDRYAGQELKRGDRIVLNEEPHTAYTVGRTFLSLADGTPLPPKAREATIYCYIEDEKDKAETDLRAAYPRIYVV